MSEFKHFEIVALNTLPGHMRMDYETRNQNLLARVDLCKRCDGTGNEFYSMFRLCTTCGGTGRNPAIALLTA